MHYRQNEGFFYILLIKKIGSCKNFLNLAILKINLLKQTLTQWLTIANL
jgi:hypothetical protein